MSNFLITGGAGFIGSNLADALAQDPNNTVIVVDDLSTGHSEYIKQKANLKFYKVDVNDLEAISKIAPAPAREMTTSAALSASFKF